MKISKNERIKKIEQIEELLQQSVPQKEIKKIVKCGDSLIQEVRQNLQILNDLYIHLGKLYYKDLSLKEKISGNVVNYFSQDSELSQVLFYINLHKNKELMSLKGVKNSEK